MKVLLSEDEEILLTAIEFRLRKHGFQVILASNGKQAMEKIKKEKPSVVIATLEMPELSGIDLVRHLRQKLKSDIPIIIIAALENGDLLLEALALGANDFVTKPFKPAELVLRIRKIMEKQKAEIKP